MPLRSPWAILLCKFNDDDTEPYDRLRYLDLFTSAGLGRFGVIDYFTDMSHGQLDISDSQVFGWFTLDKRRNEYLGSRHATTFVTGLVRRRQQMG
jgi:hypothetical protein